MVSGFAPRLSCLSTRCLSDTAPYDAVPVDTCLSTRCLTAPRPSTFVSRRSSLDWASGSRSRAIRPALASARRSLVWRARRARPPPCASRDAAPRGARGRSACCAEASDRVGRDRRRTPVHSTDVCCSRILFSQMRPQASTHAASHVPHAIREPSVSRRAGPLRRAEGPGRSVFFSERLTVSVPLMPRRPAGFPGGAFVHRRRPAVA